MNFINENTFAEACYNQNSVQQLVEGLTDDADQSDMIQWNLNEQQWRDQIKLALAEMLDDAGSNDADVTSESIIAEWANTDPADVTIDSAGDIHDGRAWLSNERLAEFYTWFASH